MISKRLTIAAAIVLLSGFGAGQALAQTNPAPAQVAQAAPADATATPAADATAPDATAPDTAATPETTPAPDAAATAPAVNPPAAAPEEPKDNPYGIGALWSKGDFVARSVIVLLAIMSAGTWYIFFVKFWEQTRMLGQAKQVEKRFWSSNNLNEGIDKLAKNSVFRSVAESGVRASSSTATGLVNPMTGSPCR